MASDEFQQRVAKKPAPDQNDPSGHARPGSPTYHPGNAPEQNLRSEDPNPAGPGDHSTRDEPAEDARKDSHQSADG